MDSSLQFPVLTSQTRCTEQKAYIALEDLHLVLKEDESKPQASSSDESSKTTTSPAKLNLEQSCQLRSGTVDGFSGKGDAT